MLKWKQTPKGRHIELGISENNLFLLLTMLGLAFDLKGEPLIPVGTIYDVFIKRGLDAFTYGAYAGAKFIIVGTPSGITLGPEGGSHQSAAAPSLGMQLPNVIYYEPCFGKELEWIFLDALRRILDPLDPSIIYLRLSTKAIAQDLFERYALKDRTEPTVREMVIKGGYRLVDYSYEPDYDPQENAVNILALGAMIPEAINASTTLKEQGIFANVINVTSPDLLYQEFYANGVTTMKGTESGAVTHLGTLIPKAERRVPMITLIDGHPLTLSFLGSIFGTELLPLGVTRFGQSGARKDLYDHYDINERAIIQAARYLVRKGLGIRDQVRGWKEFSNEK